MTNRILRVDLRDRSVVPAEAEVHVTLVPRFIDSGTEVRGRLMGPRCRFASTVEVAYHLRLILVPTSVPAFTLKAIVPEACLWEPESPHLYSGPIELWQDGVRCEVVPIRHGLRHVGLGPRGLRLNSKPLRLKGKVRLACNDEGALALRESGYNLLLAPVSEESRHVWEVADRLGFFVLGSVTKAQAPLTNHLTAHPSCLGWIMSGEGVDAEDLAPAALLGVESGNGPPHPRANFVLGSPGAPADESGLPHLFRGSAEGEVGPVSLGTVED
jgi:hypothetical protein